MLDLQKVEQEIVECLKPLEPEQIILFGSYANGQASPDSDIDLFLVKDTDQSRRKEYEVNALMRLRHLVRKYRIGFDVLSASRSFLETREDFFYKVAVRQNGKVIYG